MANLTILKPGGATRFVIASNAVDTGWVSCAFWPTDILQVTDNGTTVEVLMSNGKVWEFAHTTVTGVWQVDNVGGTTSIASSAALATLLETIRG